VAFMVKHFLFLSLLVICVSVHGSGLIDHPIVGDNITYLDGQWVASAPALGLKIQANVPGDLISDLVNAEQIPEPLYGINWKNSSIYEDNIWEYQIDFTIESEVLSSLEWHNQKSQNDLFSLTTSVNDILLVFDGIKMGAYISINGLLIGEAIDQFLRYNFSLGQLQAQSMNTLLRVGANTLTVTFDPRLTVAGRFMACTGGWDLAPYSDTYQESVPGLAHTFSKGIWKSVYLVTVSSVALTYVVPQVFYTGTYPTTPLIDGNHADFVVQVRIHFFAPSSTSGILEIIPQFRTASPTQMFVSVPAGNSNVTIPINASAQDTLLWWPTGLGAQPLYNITVRFTPNSGGAVLNATRRIGLRFFALVTGNDTDPNYVTENEKADGTDDHGMYFRVNGAAIYSRGANLVPMDELEGRYNATAFQILVRSAVDGGMNTLRVWGGGIFLPDVFYDTCDELGIIIYHDMQFAQNHSPSQTSTQEEEFRHQIRRLSHHPSISIWDGCNECQVVLGTDTGIYATFVLAVVESEDMSRALWPSCPADGWSSGVWRLSALPNGYPLGLLPKAVNTNVHIQSPLPANIFIGGPVLCNFTNNTDVQNITGGMMLAANSTNQCCELCWQDTFCTSAVYWEQVCYIKYGGTPVSAEGRTMCVPINKPPPPVTIETHGPYQLGGGFDAVNGNALLIPFPSDIPIVIDNSTKIGLQYKNIYASEFGCSVFTSFESLSPTLNSSNWGIHGGMPPDVCVGGFEKVCEGGNPMSQRNYPCDNIITVYFGPSNFSAVGEQAFKQHLWQCMIGQALEIKSNIETRRGQNQFGCLIWQLNEIWPTGGWGSIEYGTPAISGQVIGGRWKPLQYWLRKSIFADVMVTCGAMGQCFVRNDGAARSFSGIVTVGLVSFSTAAVKILTELKVNLSPGPGVIQWFTIDLTGVTGQDWILVATVTQTGGPIVSENVIPLVNPGNMTGLLNANVTFVVSNSVNADGTVDIMLNSDVVALYVTLTTLANGRFSDNAFLMLPGQHLIQFIPFNGPVDLATLTSTLRVEHVASYMSFSS